MLAWQTSDTLSTVAIVLSVGAIVFSAMQAVAARHGNAPTVTLTARTNGQVKEYGSVTVNVSSRHRIRSVWVSAMPGSAVDQLGASDSRTVDQPSVTITDPASGADVVLPCHWATKGNARMKIVVKGEGFARTTTVLEAHDSAPQVWAY